MYHNTKLYQIRKITDAMLLTIDDLKYRRNGYVHLYGVGMAAAILALKRGHDLKYAESASIAGILHDYISYMNRELDDDNHAHNCEPIVRDILNQLKITDETETDMICSAVYNHSDKDNIDSEFDEIIKDADVIHHWLRNPMESVNAYEYERVNKLIAEFGFDITVDKKSEED